MQVGILPWSIKELILLVSFFLAGVFIVMCTCKWWLSKAQRDKNKLQDKLEILSPIHGRLMNKAPDFVSGDASSSPVMKGKDTYWIIWLASFFLLGVLQLLTCTCKTWPSFDWFIGNLMKNSSTKSILNHKCKRKYSLYIKKILCIVRKYIIF